MSDFQKVLGKLLRGSRLQPPFVWEDKLSYKFDLIDRIDNFNNRIFNFKATGEVEAYLFEKKHEIHQMTGVLLQVLQEYLWGSSGKAYAKFEELMNLPIIQENIVLLIDELKKYSSNNQALFRVRLSDAHISEQSDIFHIPFQMRHLVRSQRYSIAGLPCLYLGSSIYVCWQEMGKPDLNKLYVSRYQTESTASLKILNFAYSLETLKQPEMEELFIGENDVKGVRKQAAHIVMYPLLMSCSYNRRYENASFNIEYVIPNLLLQWINSEKSNVSGVAYFSTKTKQLRHSQIGINYVFPPDILDIPTEGYCTKLARSFLFTKPISWQLLDTIGGSELFELSKFPNFDDVEKSFVENYKITKFHQAEEKLRDIFRLNQLSQN